MVRPTRPNLGSGKARDAYTDIHAPDNLTYDELKRAILEGYAQKPIGVNSGATLVVNTSHSKAHGKLAYLFDKWVETSIYQRHTKVSGK